MPSVKSYIINVKWDGEAKVWWAESNDIPGLVSEALTFPDLVQNVLAVAPELIELNAPNSDDGTLVFNSVHVEPIRMHV